MMSTHAPPLRGSLPPEGADPAWGGPAPDRMSGWLCIAGLGPGADAQITPEVTQALAEATDVLGYIPYVARVAPRSGLTLHPSDNREELERARAALALAAEGGRVVLVSSGDPGVFAMAAAVFEAMEGRPDWQALDVRVLPGITAMLAAAARAGAPLGHDFCALNLSDNLKPWSLIEQRLRAVVGADMAVAFYNPRSANRPHTFEQVLQVLRETCAPDRLLLFARAVSTPQERLLWVPLGAAQADMADMRTVVIVGSSTTRRVGRFVYTPRSARAA
ncbi:precorrin-3B C(17)-methyltransferase [Hydrogenophaga electricum]|uniref:Precorrin-3B C(17)-methyltransferase n=2 Tax=Hydrogenophaga electricum TaxID=1230953 RepID=A0ABQ6CA19_9BURK|nr:precorrin-3B C(17)-methyltransferase [Hydrogenophaga electricum]